MLTTQGSLPSGSQPFLLQVSKQCVQLHQKGWLQADDADGPSGIIKMQNPEAPDIKEPVIVAGGWCGPCLVCRGLVLVDSRSGLVARQLAAQWGSYSLVYHHASVG